MLCRRGMASGAFTPAGLVRQGRGRLIREIDIGERPPAMIHRSTRAAGSGAVSLLVANINGKAASHLTGGLACLPLTDVSGRQRVKSIPRTALLSVTFVTSIT